ncbi:efflux RND transporter permease subunit, partial [Pseudoalteromonas sp. SIMBA_153]
RQRLRPIIMTSLAFGLGVVPLFLANGPGSGSQNAIGTSVVGGVITATLLGIFFIPMFYIWVRSAFPHQYENNTPNDKDVGNGTPNSHNPTPSESYQPASLGDNTQ